MEIQRFTNFNVCLKQLYSMYNIDIENFTLQSKPIKNVSKVFFISKFLAPSWKCLTLNNFSQTLFSEKYLNSIQIIFKYFKVKKIYKHKKLDYKDR